MQKLNKTQEKLAHQKHIGVSAIKGAEDTGKTAIAMSRMIYLLEHACKKGERVLFVSSQGKTVERANRYLNDYYSRQNLSLFDEEPKAVAVVRSTQQLMSEAAEKAFICFNRKKIESYPEELIVRAVKDVKKLYPRVRWLRKENAALIGEELVWMSVNNLMSLSQYQEIPRRGAQMKLPKKGNGRKALWQIKMLVEAEMKQKGLISQYTAAQETLVYVKEDCLRSCFEHMIIDDAEKLTKVEFELLYALWAKGKGEALFLMDPQQETALSFLNKGKGFKQAGFDMTGRTRHLKPMHKKAAASKKKQAAQLTPLEAFILSMQQEKQPQEAGPAGREKKSSLPWYVETYEFINKLTGVRTIFQKDTSAGETYIDEVKQDDVDVLPVYSDIAAGMPIEIVDEVSGSFEMPSELIHHKRSSYILHVQGDSMTGADISDGDYVVIQAGNVADHEIAAVYYNGATTLKRIVQEQDHVLLVSENPKYRPIVIEDGDFRVMGRLIGVIKPIA